MWGLNTRTYYTRAEETRRNDKKTDDKFYCNCTSKGTAKIDGIDEKAAVLNPSFSTSCCQEFSICEKDQHNRVQRRVKE